MEVKEFLIPFRKNWRLILGAALALGLVAYGVSLRLPLKYQAIATLYVHHTVQDGEGEYFEYEGFYAQRSAQEFTDTILGFLESPDIKQRAGEIVWDKVTEQKQRQLQKAVHAEKTAPQLVQLSVTLDNREEAGKLLSALVQSIKEKARVLTQNDAQTELNLLTAEPLSRTVKPRKLLNAAVAAGIGFMLACVFVWLKEYLEGEAEQ